jgi:hypothetical protein
VAAVTRTEATLTAPRRRRARWVPPLMAAAAVCLLAGLWAALIRLGLSVPAGISSLPDAHGPLMTLGFLGTLIALERAVALGEARGYLAPAAAGAGGLAVAAGAPGGVGEALPGCGGLVLAGIFVALYVPLVLLHASLVLRLAGGDWAGNTAAWQWGGALNEVAVLLFLVLAAMLMIRSRRPTRRSGLGDRLVPRIRGDEVGVRPDDAGPVRPAG